MEGREGAVGSRASLLTSPSKYSAPEDVPDWIIEMSCPVISANRTSTSSSLVLFWDISFHRSLPPSTYWPHFSHLGLRNEKDGSELKIWIKGLIIVNGK